MTSPSEQFILITGNYYMILRKYKLFYTHIFEKESEIDYFGARRGGGDKTNLACGAKLLS